MKIFDAIAKLKRRNHDADPLEVAEWLDDLDGHIYKEFSGSTVTVKELTDEEMPEAYRVFGLTRHA